MAQKVIYQTKSAFQSVELVLDDDMGLMLVLDEHIQFAQSDEYRYHEGLGVIPWLYSNAKDILICGGGDGLLATRLLKLPHINKITIVDIDRAVTELAREHPLLVELNEGSMRDNRVEVLNQDAYTFLEQCTRTYDMILCDFPDPFFPELNKLYSREFYQMCSDHLSLDGIMSVQSCFSYSLLGIIASTMKSIFPYVQPYRVYTPVFRNSGFNLAAKQPVTRKNRIPAWTRYINEDIVQSIGCFAKDESDRINAEVINTVSNYELTAHAYLNSYTKYYRYPYCDDTVLLDSRNFKKNIRNTTELEALIRVVNANRNIVFYVARDRKELAKALITLGFERITTLDYVTIDLRDGRLIRNVERMIKKYKSALMLRSSILYCRPTEHAGLTTLVGQYFAAHRQVFFDRYGNIDKALQEQAHYYYFEDEKHMPAGFIKLNYYGKNAEAEIILGVGSAGGNIGIMLLAIMIALQEGLEYVAMYVPYPKVTGLLKKLGFASNYSIEVLVSDKKLT